MDCPLHWRHVSTCYRVICAYCAYVTIRRTLGDTRCTPRHFVNKVSVRQFSAENKQGSADFILNICRCTPVTSYERSNQNLPSRWVLAWSVQKWILWVIIERWEAFGPSTLRGCRQLGRHVNNYAVTYHLGTDDVSPLLSGEPDYFGRNKISSGGDLSHYSSASLY